jgi:mannose-6-phosphate isomerase-like protein (cupin superfamily)
MNKIYMREYYIKNIEEETRKNRNYRKVLYNNKDQQIVLMSIKVGEEIGMERHDEVDQFIKIEEGEGIAIIREREYKLCKGSVVLIPRGFEHNIINKGEEVMKLYSIYSPPEHRKNLINRTKPKK